MHIKWSKSKYIREDEAKVHVLDFMATFSHILHSTALVANKLFTQQFELLHREKRFSDRLEVVNSLRYEKVDQRLFVSRCYSIFCFHFQNPCEMHKNAI